MSVGGPFTTFTRANSNVPGKYAFPYEYWMHGSGLCVFEVWWPTQSYRNAPVAMFVPGETYGHLEVYENMHGMFTAYPKQLALAKAMSAAGWVVISVGYPAGGLNSYTANTSNSPTPGAFRISGSWGEVPPVAMWPEQPYYLARAIQHVKDNFDALTTPFGANLYGFGNSINPSKVVLVGMKHGATMAMTTALMPSGLYSFDRSLAHESQDMFFPRTSHLVKAVVVTDPMIDFTQFHIAPNYSSLSPAPEMFQGDKWAAFARAEDKSPWSRVESVRKKVCPLWLLQEAYAEQADLPFYIEFSGVGFGDPLWDEDLDADDWEPGTTRDDTANAKAWIDPTNGTFQGAPTRTALREWGQGQQVASGAIIRTSIVKYYDAQGDHEPDTSATTYTTNVMAALTNWGL